MTKLEQMRTEKTLTQEVLASAANIAISTYSMYENGQRLVPRRIAEAIACTLGCEVSDIFLPEKFTVCKTD